MADYESLPDFDDELLSAYLDDELTPDERALVEERLAADPAARHLLEQLRAVSQALKGLPAEAVGHDLRPAILERAEQAMLGSGTSFPRLSDQTERRSSPAGSSLNSLPPFSVGRTRRGWFWAGLAVAAALFVAFMQSDNAEDDDLPDVAVRSHVRRDDIRVGGAQFGTGAAPTNEPAETAPASGAGLADLRAGREPSELTLGVPVAGVEVAPPAPSRSLAESSVASDSAADPDSAPAHSVDALGTRGGAAVRGGAVGGLSREVAPMDAAALEDSLEGAATDEAGLASSDEDPLVVHVNVTPAAFRNKTFDRVLLSNGIAVESEPAAEPAGAAAESLATSSRRFSETRAEEEALAPTDENLVEQQPEQEVDLVFVEAPPEQIFGCLKTLSDDLTNYRAVEIDDTTPTSKLTATKNVAVEQNWSMQFNRGSVPPQQKQQYREDANFYYQAEQGAAEVAAGESAAIRAKDNSLAYGVFSGKAENLGRARRVQAPAQNARAYAQRQTGRGLATADNSAIEAEQLDKRARSPQEAKTMSTEAVDQLQVLFVLKPQNGDASSPPAADPPE